MIQIPKRHCWECRWRGLVCDFTQPGCKRCSAAATPCPGYGEKEPQRLKWLTPGKAKAWTRRSPKEKTNSPPDTNRQSDSESPKELIVPAPLVKTNEDAIFQAIEYCTLTKIQSDREVIRLELTSRPDNSAMYPLKVTLNELGDNPTVLKIGPAHIKVGITKPDFVRLNMVCMALYHRINRAEDRSQALTLKNTYYRFRGVILRSLNEEIRSENLPNKIYILINGILSFILADVSLTSELKAVINQY